METAISSVLKVLPEARERRARSVVWAVNVVEQAQKISETLSPRRTGLRNFTNEKTENSNSDDRIRVEEKTTKLFDKIMIEGNLGLMWSSKVNIVALRLSSGV